MGLSVSIFYYWIRDYDSAFDIAKEAFKYAVGDINLSKEAAHIAERIQKVLSEMVKELITQKDDKIEDLKEERKALQQEQQALAQSWASFVRGRELLVCDAP